MHLRVIIGCLEPCFVEFMHVLVESLVRYSLLNPSVSQLNTNMVISVGTGSALSLLLIGYDRYNVIVKGINGFRMTYGGSCLFILAIWIYSILVCVPPFFGWGEYALGKTKDF